MAQLKTLLDEKNATIERYQQKLLNTGANMSSPPPVAHPLGTACPPSTSSHSTLSNESESTVAKLRRAVTNGNLDCVSEAGSEERNSLTKQVDALAALVKDKETRIHTLEKNLCESQDGRTASEKRCNDALREMDRINGDMQSLARSSIAKAVLERALRDPHSEYPKEYLIENNFRKNIAALADSMKMLRSARDTCGGCGVEFEGKERKFCRDCRTYCYCSREFQKQHWNRKNDGHCEDCKAATELKRKMKEAKKVIGW